MNRKIDGFLLSQIIACCLLLLAIASLPYGYYQFLRIVITATAIVNCIHIYRLENKAVIIIYLIVAIIFNPLIPIYFGKSIWIGIDLVIAIFFGFMSLKRLR